MYIVSFIFCASSSRINPGKQIEDLKNCYEIGKNIIAETMSSEDDRIYGLFADLQIVAIFKLRCYFKSNAQREECLSIALLCSVN